MIATHEKYTLLETLEFLRKAEKENLNLKKEIKKRDELLEMSNCPTCKGFGAYHNDDCEVVFCQWCDDVRNLDEERR